MKNKLLVVYNTCGVKAENIEYYTASIDSILNQDFEDYRVVVSMFKNSFECKKALAQKFGNKISYVFYDKERLTVNQTFNKTVQICVEKFGKFEGYLYVDSGVIFGSLINAGSFKHNQHVLKNIYELFKSGPYSMVTLQVDLDAGYQHIGYEYQSRATDTPQIQGQDFIVPVGSAVNLHAQIFSHEIYENFNHKLIPDVFAAYCTESTFSFLNAIVHEKWVIMKDILISHLPSLEGASVSFFHHSLIHRNSWNNLLYERNALDFINDPEAVDAGLGYEECNNIMMHKEAAYDENGFAKYPEKLKAVIKKYLFLSKEELDYDKIVYKTI